MSVSRPEPVRIEAWRKTLLAFRREGLDAEDTILAGRSILLVSFSIPELFLGRIGKGHRVEVATWAARERAIFGEIVDLGSRIDPGSRSFTARCSCWCSTC